MEPGQAEIKSTETSQAAYSLTGGNLTKKEDIGFRFIQTQAELDGLTEKLQKAASIALDTEADSFHHYFQKVCLIQLSFDQTNVIVDPLAGLDLSGLLGVLAEKGIVLHDAGYDLRMLKKDFGFFPRGQIYDTMLAGKLLGLKRLGLEGMLEDVLGVEINKVSQRADWSARPLSENLLSYAASDTHHLLMLWDALEEKLQRLGRLSWHRESCQRAAMEHQQTENRENQWRIRGSRELSRRGLEFLKSLWYWRDEQSQKSDVPAFRIIGNEQLLSIARKAQYQENPSVETIGKLPRNLRGSRLGTLQKALERGLPGDADGWPEQLKAERSNRPDVRILRRIDYLRNRCQETAEGLGLQPETIASRSALGRIAAGPDADLERLIEEGVLMRWQARLLAEAVMSAFSEQHSG